MVFDITNFTEDCVVRDTFDYRMLIYGNYTFRNNLEADSFVLVLHRILKYLNKHYKVHFTLLTPELIHSVSQYKNVEQIIYPLPTYNNTMRTHFDADLFMRAIDWKSNDFDIIYSHLPEHTAPITNVIYNNTHLQPKIIGYSHWFEVPENAPYEKNMFPASLFGMLEMEECGVNSLWLKNLVLHRSGKYLSNEIFL